MCWEITVTLIGITLTFIVGVINIIVTLRQSNKNTFINTITIARKEYLSMPVSPERLLSGWVCLSPGPCHHRSR